MAKDNFPFFESYYESFKNLPPEVVGQIVLSMGALFFDDQEPELDGVSKAIFELIRPVVDNSKHISESRTAAVNKRWSKNKDSDTNEIQTEYKPDTNKIQNGYKPDTEKDKDKDKDKDLNPQTPLDRIFENEKLNNVFLEYLDTRGKTGNIERVQRELYNMAKGDIDTMIKILEKSLAMGWKGIFPLKDEKARGPTNRMKNHDEREYAMSDLEAEFSNKFMKGAT